MTMRTSVKTTLHARQGIGNVLVALATVLVVALIFAAYSAAQLHYAAKTTRALAIERADDHLFDTAAFLHGYDFAGVVDGNEHHLGLVEREPVWRCVIVGWENGALYSKQYRLAGNDNPNSLCNSSRLASTVKERYVLDDSLAGFELRFLDDGGREVNPNNATWAVFDLTDARTGRTQHVRLPVNR